MEEPDRVGAGGVVATERGLQRSSSAMTGQLGQFAAQCLELRGPVEPEKAAQICDPVGRTWHRRGQHHQASGPGPVLGPVEVDVVARLLVVINRRLKDRVVIEDDAGLDRQPRGRLTARVTRPRATRTVAVDTPARATTCCNVKPTASRSTIRAASPSVSLLELLGLGGSRTSPTTPADPKALFQRHNVASLTPNADASSATEAILVVTSCTAGNRRPA